MQIQSYIPKVTINFYYGTFFLMLHCNKLEYTIKSKD
jgi:hypothetical protein